MSISQADILKALSTVDDPDLKKDLVTLGMIKDVVVSDSKVSFSVVLTTPACPLKEKIRKDCETAVRAVFPEGEIDINMTSNVTSGSVSEQLKGVKNIIAIASGKGGVGKSTIASNLAVALGMTGAKTGLVDADIYGPSLPIMFGLEGERPMVRQKDGKDWIVPFEKFNVKMNSIGLLIPPEQALVWRGPMASRALSQLIFDTDWGDLDYLVIDLPPGTGDLHLTLVQKLSVTGALLVTTPQDIAIADARKGAGMFTAPQINVPILGVVENMAYFTPADMPDKQYFIFGKGGGEKLAADFQTSVLAQIPIVEQVRELGDMGVPVATDPESTQGIAFRKLAEEVARQVAIRNAGGPPTQPVEILYK